MNEQTTEKTSKARTVSGRVLSNKMQKTITVVVERQMAHPLYGKILRRRTKLHAHDEKNDSKPGDLVLIQECRPLSKTKSWRLVEILERAPEELIKPSEPGVAP